MKKLFILSVSLFVVTVVQAFDDNTRVITPYDDFEEGSIERMYGDNVILRKKPDVTSNALDTLSIGQEIEIVRKMEDTIRINGRRSNWYKVKVNGAVGYVAGGLISLDHREIDGDLYLVIYAQGDAYYSKVRCRVLRKDGEFYGREFQPNNDAFYLSVSGNRGIEGVENMLCIHLFAEACGVDGGQVYLFNDGERLIEAIHLSSVSDGGVFWFGEEIKFPDESYWGTNVCVYEREYGEPINEELNLSRAVVHTMPIKWENGAFTPNPKDIDFDEGQ